MKNPISMGIQVGVLSLAGIGFLAHGFYTGNIAFASKTKPIILKAECTEPQITSIQFNAEIVKFLVLDNRLHLLMPLPITGAAYAQSLNLRPDYNLPRWTVKGCC